MVRGAPGLRVGRRPHDPATAVAGLLQAGARRVVVASYLLAPGVFADRIRDMSLAAGAAAVSAALGASADVADVILDRYQEAETRKQRPWPASQAPAEYRTGRASGRRG